MSVCSHRSSDMGNCLKRSSTSSDPPLLSGHEAETESNRASPTDLRGSAYLEVPMLVPVLYYPSPSVVRTGFQLTEEEQVRIAQRIGLIQNLPEGKYDDCEINTECVICMIEFEVGDHVRYLPCLHTYHASCIDSWLMRRFTCPSCMEPVDTQGLLGICES